MIIPSYLIPSKPIHPKSVHPKSRHPKSVLLKSNLIKLFHPFLMWFYGSLGSRFEECNTKEIDIWRCSALLLGWFCSQLITTFQDSSSWGQAARRRSQFVSIRHLLCRRELISNYSFSFHEIMTWSDVWYTNLIWTLLSYHTVPK